MYKVLIVDDEPEIASGIAFLVNRYCSDICQIVSLAHDGNEGYHAAKSYQPDIVLTDIRMPGCDGLEMIRRLRQDDADIEFVVLSGYAEFEYARQAIQLGVRNYLTKPIDEEELENSLRKITTLIGERRDVEPKEPDPLEGIPKKKDVVEEARDYIRQNFNRSIGLNEISERFFINPYYFSQLFKKKTGMKYQDYVTELRIDRAQRLLKESDLKLYEICEMIGYSDMNHFNRIFEREVGLKPGEYRKKLREK